ERTVHRNSFESREVGERPYFSPISLHPKFARAIINLTGVKKGGTILDPFCGTGGIVIEAASMGMKVIASDFDSEMVAGTLENMDYYGMKLCDSEVLDVLDIADRFGEVDAVVTDPPYGRNTHISEKNVENIYRIAMNSFYDVLLPGGAVGIIFPYPVDDRKLRRECMFIQKVHRSLSRHYCVFRREL
ncbi:MAG: RsmD family RNA methyltransferase, partial [archaeon]|nr:RsmD family RNA methyltransferase [archaeon]